MTAMPDIRLPDELTPRDGRFGSGPSKVAVAGLTALAETGASYLGTSHRQPTVRNVVGDIRAAMTALYSLPDGYEVVLGVGGATAFWDAAAFGLIDAKSQHLSFGEFSSKFAKVAAGAPHLAEPEIIQTDPGSHPTPEARSDIDVYALTHNETSTGVMMPIIRPDGADGLVAVDATSAAGAAPLDPQQCDVYYFSPQKALGSEGGLWVALMSPDAIARIEMLGRSDRWIPPFLALDAAVANSRKNQTYNTPSLATIFLLRHQLNRMLENGGLEWGITRSTTSSSCVYEWAEASEIAYPFVADTSMRSITVATVDLIDDYDADTVEAVLRSNGILDTGGYRKLGRNQLRISCFPNVDPADVARLTAAIDYIVERL